MYKILFILIATLISNYSYGKDIPMQGKHLPPKRIVSLAPVITESLYSLGTGNRIIANTLYCNYPKEAKNKEKIGTMLEPNIEKILSLEPDMVIGSAINPPQVIERLQTLGIRVEVFPDDTEFGAICENFLSLGKLVGMEYKAKKIILKVRQEINIIKQKISKLPKPSPTVFWQLGKNPLVTVAKGTFADELIRLSGGKNIASNLKIKYPRISLEEVIRQNPEIIIIVSMGDVTKDEVEAWRQYEEIRAVKNNRVYVIDADSVCRATPLRFLEGLRKVSACIHPEIMK